MAVKNFSLSLLIGFAGILTLIAPGPLTEAKSGIDTHEKPTLNRSMVEQKQRRSGLRVTYADKYPLCWFWTYIGLCTYYRAWMNANCPTSCPCSNLDSDAVCDQKASEGLCDINNDYMRTFCRKSCNHCPSCKCGQANEGHRNRIVGGVDTDPHEYPWQVLLVRIFSDGSIDWFCGGSIISNQEILTAAHCLYDENDQPINIANMRVLVGQHDLSQYAFGSAFQDPLPEKTFGVIGKRIPLHYPFHFQLSSLNNDFAILILHKQIEFTQDVSPVCLPDPTEQDENVNTIVTGWGYLSDHQNNPDVLQKITVQTIENTPCKNIIQGARLSGPPISDSMLCGHAAGKTTCHGDSGGPWVTKVARNFILTGVHSWGTSRTTGATKETCIPGAPTVAARVRYQLTWIKDNMKGATCPRDPRP